MAAYIVFIAVMVGLLAAANDISISWTSPVLPKLYSNDSSINPLDRPITEGEDAWIGSLMTVGAVIGPLPVGFLSEKLGRKIGLIVIAMPILIGFFTLTFTTNIMLIYISRVLCGLAVGSGYAMLPLYLAEISQDHNRGMISQVINVFWSIGNFFCYTVGSYTSYKVFNLSLAMIPTSFFILFAIFAPETPYYLLTRNKPEKAVKSLMLLRSATKEEVQEELEHIRSQICKKEDDVKLTEIFKNIALRRAFIICLILIAAQELCGFVCILFYMQPIFEAADTGISADISAIVVAFFLFSSSLINPFLVDRAGRRFLLIVSSFGLGLALFLLGLFFYIQTSTDIDETSIFWLPLFSLILYIFSFNFGISSIPSTIFSEIFPNNCKDHCNTIIATFGWAICFFTTNNFNLLNNTVGRSGTFWFFAVCCLSNAIFCIFCVPETKGKSFASIQEDLRTGNFFKLGLRINNLTKNNKCVFDNNGLELNENNKEGIL